MDPHPHFLRRDSGTLQSHRGLPRQPVNYFCPHCLKEYRTSTWLDNHIKTKHSSRAVQGLSRSLADEIHNRRSIANRASMLPQLSVPQDQHHFTLIEELQAMASLLKSFLPRIDDLMTLLQEPNGGHSRTRSIEQCPLRELKRRASSQDLHRQTKRQGISTSAFDVSIPQTTDPIHFNRFESQNPSLVSSAWEGDHFRLDISEHPRGLSRYPSFEQRELRPSRTAKTQSSTSNATQMFQVSPRQQQGRLSPCEQLVAHLHGASPTRLSPKWTPPESMVRMTDTPLQESLDLLSHEPGQRASPLRALQESLDCPGPASQHNFGNAFDQTQQYDFLNEVGLDRTDFPMLTMQHGETLEEEGHGIPFHN